MKFYRLNLTDVTVSKEDLRSYEPLLRRPGRLEVPSTTTTYELVYPVNSGSGGEAAALAVAILAEVYRVQDSKDEADVYHATVEALKFAFARRSLLNGTVKGSSPISSAVRTR